MTNSLEDVPYRSGRFFDARQIPAPVKHEMQRLSNLIDASPPNVEKLRTNNTLLGRIQVVYHRTYQPVLTHAPDALCAAPGSLWNKMRSGLSHVAGLPSPRRPSAASFPESLAPLSKAFTKRRDLVDQKDHQKANERQSEEMANWRDFGLVCGSLRQQWRYRSFFPARPPAALFVDAIPIVDMKRHRTVEAADRVVELTLAHLSSKRSVDTFVRACTHGNNEILTVGMAHVPTTIQSWTDDLRRRESRHFAEAACDAIVTQVGQSIEALWRKENVDEVTAAIRHGYQIPWYGTLRDTQRITQGDETAGAEAACMMLTLTWVRGHLFVAQMGDFHVDTFDKDTGHLLPLSHNAIKSRRTHVVPSILKDAQLSEALVKSHPLPSLLPQIFYRPIEQAKFSTLMVSTPQTLIQLSKGELEDILQNTPSADCSVEVAKSVADATWLAGATEHSCVLALCKKSSGTETGANDVGIA